MWIETEIEKLLESEIHKQSSSLLYENQYKTFYDTVKIHCIKNIYSNIIAIEPNLTDHGEVHIQNVLQNAYELIKNSKLQLSGIELYVLCMSILVHDIGNLSGREGHESKLKEYFNSTQFPTIDKKHITQISQVAKSHGGRDCDTIGSLKVHTLDGKEVRGKKIAAILRFADELAEGKQRTSLIMLDKGFIDTDSSLYHVYASILDIPTITNDTIILTYNICLDEHQNILEELLKFIHKRVNKLYKELQYCGHYCEDINNIKKVSVSISMFENQDDFEPINVNSMLLNFELSGQNAHCIKDFDLNLEYIELAKSLSENFQTKQDTRTSLSSNEGKTESKTSILKRIFSW